jgi:hypothetical protein
VFDVLELPRKPVPSCGAARADHEG